MDAAATDSVSATQRLDIAASVPAHWIGHAPQQILTAIGLTLTSGLTVGYETNGGLLRQRHTLAIQGRADVSRAVLHRAVWLLEQSAGVKVRRARARDDEPQGSWQRLGGAASERRQAVRRAWPRPAGSGRSLQARAPLASERVSSTGARDSVS